MKQETMKKGQTVDDPHNDLSENTAYSLTFQGNAHHWGKNTLILAGKYQSEKPLWWLLLERDDGKFKAEWCF